MRQDQTQPLNRAAYSPAEFAALFNKHATWSYRLLYAGKIKALTGLGRILIPATELERVIGPVETYNSKPKPRKTKDEKAGEQ